MEKHIFISYSTHDASIAFKIVDFLEQNGHTCWIAPRNIRSGLDYTDVINSALEDCSALILVLSSSSVQSQFVKKELTTAISLNKTILPFKISQVNLQGGFMFMLNNVQWIDATSHPECMFHHLLEGLEHKSILTPSTHIPLKHSNRRWIVVSTATLLIVGAVLLIALPNDSHTRDTEHFSTETTTISKSNTTTPTDSIVSLSSQKNEGKDHLGKNNSHSQKEKENIIAEKNKTNDTKETEKNDKDTMSDIVPSSIQSSPTDNRNARLKKARIFYNSGKYGPALEIYTKLKAEYPLDASIDEMIEKCHAKMAS